MDGTNRNNIKVGSKVKVVEKQIKEQGNLQKE